MSLNKDVYAFLWEFFTIYILSYPHTFSQTWNNMCFGGIYVKANILSFIKDLSLYESQQRRETGSKIQLGAPDWHLKVMTSFNKLLLLQPTSSLWPSFQISTRKSIIVAPWRSKITSFERKSQKWIVFNNFQWNCSGNFAENWSNMHAEDFFFFNMADLFGPVLDLGLS